MFRLSAPFADLIVWCLALADLRTSELRQCTEHMGDGILDERESVPNLVAQVGV